MRSREDGALSPRAFVFCCLVLLLCTPGVVFFVVPIILQDGDDVRALQQRGVATRALAKRSWSTQGGARSPTSYHLEITFTAPDGATVTDDVYVTRGESDAIPIPSSVPILFDPLQPRNARLNLHNSVRRAHPLLTTLASLVFVALCLACGWALAIGGSVARFAARKDGSGRARTAGSDPVPAGRERENRARG